MRRTWLILLTAGITAVGLLLAALFTERQVIEAHRWRQKTDVHEQLLLLQSRLEGNLRSNILLVQGLVSVIAAHPDLDQAQFERYARPLFEGRSTLRNIGAAPDMVIRLMVPLAGNEKAIGLDFRKTPTQFESAERARTTGELVLAGPLTLAQGGTGLIGRIPVFAERKGERYFWGLISAVIDVDRLYRESGLADEGLPIEVALRGKDGLGAAGAAFYGDTDLFAADAVFMDLDLPSGQWQMAGRPKGGWSDQPPELDKLRLGFLLVALLMLMPMLLLARYEQRQQRVETNLAMSEARLSLAVEAARQGVWDWDLLANRIEGNRKFAEILGFPTAMHTYELGNFLALMHPEDVARVESAIDVHLHDRVAQLECDFRLRAQGNAGTDDWHWFRVLGRIVERNAAGRPVRLSGVLQDITTLKTVQLELEAARVAAEAGSRAKSEFLATMSHEIRTPMNGVLGMADLLLLTPLNEEQKSFVVTLQNSGRSLLSIINDILDFSKIEAGRLTLEAVDFDLAALAGEVCDLLRPRAAEKDLLLTLDCPEGLALSLRGDALRIRQVLVNLVGNAIKFTREGRIDVEIGWRPAEAGMALVRLAVRDTGIGIPQEAQGRLFNLFSQVDASTTRRFGGTGLGLTISKRLVEAMQGRIGVVSAPDEGACFWFELKLPIGNTGSTAGAATLRRDAHEIAKAGDEGVRFHGRVLLVEDNPVNVQVARQMLSRLGVEVIVAENGRLGVERFAAEHFDLVLMDIQMPEMDGLEATLRVRHLQAESSTGMTPVVALTANVQPDDRERCFAAGMNDFVAKPFRQEDLVRVLQRWLGAKVGHGATPQVVPAAPATPATVVGTGPTVGAGGTAVPAPQNATADPAAAALAVFDVRTLDDLSNATGMSVADLIAMMFSDIERMAGELETACETRETKDMRRMAHSIKSSSAQLGAMRLSAVGRAMEAAVRDDQPDACIDRLPEFRAALAELRAALKQA